MKKTVLLAIGLLWLLLPVAASGNKEAVADVEVPAVFAGENTDIGEGTITVLTNVTEGNRLAVMEEYARQFDDLYPGTQKIEFESIDDYENQVKIRLSSSNYGDVLLIPNTVEISKLGEYFESLGDYNTLSQKYLCIDDRTFNNLVYGIPVSIQFTGIFYNREVFKKAGINSIPKTIDGFLTALEQIKRNTDAIPLYTAYYDQWTLNQWEANTLTVSTDPDYPYVLQAHDRNNFGKGSPNYNLYRVMYESAKRGLIEDDPAIATFDEAKRLLAKGEVATYVCSSWAIGQFKEAAMDAGYDAGIVGYMPYPVPNIDDPQYVRLGRDYVNGISIHSSHKDIAAAWVKFFAESQYASELSSSISPLVGGELPSVATDWYDLGVEFSVCTPAMGSDQGLLDALDKESGVGLLEADFKQRIIDSGIGNRNETYDDIMGDLNAHWVQAMNTLGVK
jgi:ABC-type glycerol-3-phosphate transport system substrate-binding protein